MAVLTAKQNPPVFSKLGKKTTGLTRPLEGQKWFVAITKPQCEKKLAWHLHLHAVTYFLPMQVKRTPTNGKVHELIFPGFVFFCGYPRDLYTAWESRRMRGLLQTKLQARLRKNLRQVARVVHAGIKLTRVEDFQPGVKVRVTCGKLEGLTGRVDLRKNNRVWLDISLVGSSSFEIDAQLLEVVK